MWGQQQTYDPGVELHKQNYLMINPGKAQISSGQALLAAAHKSRRRIGKQ